MCRERGIAHEERTVTLPELVGAEGVFLTLSTWGIVEVGWIDQRPVRVSPLVRDLWTGYWKLVSKATGGITD
jgi:branched-subunit amino acid aminotransferase/4-amino-4-deoxychorismate lyase